MPTNECSFFFLQGIHRLTPPNLNREGPVGFVENPTEEPEFFIRASDGVIYVSDWC